MDWREGEVKILVWTCRFIDYRSGMMLGLHVLVLYAEAKPPNFIDKRS